MSARLTADRQLVRLLGFLPRAARSDGISLTELAEMMELPEKEILKDLTEVLNRAFYQPAGSAEDVQVMIGAERIRVWTTGEFRRPLRLTRRESIALGLALRVVASARQDEGAEMLAKLARKFEGIRLAEPRSEEVSHFALFPEAIPAGIVHEVIARAVRQRKRCRIEYLKPGATGAGEREIDPYALIGSKGRWYAIGQCHASSEIRVFRLDRVLSAIPLATSFEVPDGFDASAYVEDARVFRAEEAPEATVRYSPQIARWIREQGSAEELPDGSVVVRYRVADRDWLVRHVLSHGPEAEVIAPAEIRAQVQRTAEKILALH